MPDQITLDDINKILDLATLHGRIENWVFQTSTKGSQQIKIVTSESYLHNSINTALRTRTRRIMSYSMRNHNPANDTNYSEFIKDLYLNTIYLFYTPTISIKAKYLNITKKDSYTIFRSDSPEPIYTGIISPDQSFTFQETQEKVFSLICFQDGEVLHSIDIKTVNEMYDITKFYNKLFNLINYYIPDLFVPDGFVIITNTLDLSGNFIET